MGEQHNEADSYAAHYLLGDLLGSGGMGTVHGATQLSLGRYVALKRPHPELAAQPHVSRRFRAEALAGGRLDHKNVTRVIDFGGLDGSLFLVMEYVPGVSLETIIAEQGPMSTATAIELGCQVLAGLQAAHVARIIHADIKTGNVLVEWLADGTMHARLIDFGLARFCDEPSFDDERLLSGTPAYLAPELIRGGLPTVASDIYAAGVLFYELLTGKTPFEGGTSDEILQRQLDDDVVPPSLRCPDQAIPPAIEDAIMRALAKDPDARFVNAASFALALRASSLPPQVTRARPARGTPSTAFSVEATTRDWPLEKTMKVPAISALGTSDDIQRSRIAVGDAMKDGNGDIIVASYLELVRALVDQHQLGLAVGELQRGLAVLRPRVQETTPVWRLQLCLAALYSGLGDPVRARLAATAGRDDAVRAASNVGEDRADELLQRLTRTKPARHV